MSYYILTQIFIHLLFISSTHWQASAREYEVIHWTNQNGQDIRTSTSLFDHPGCDRLSHHRDHSSILICCSGKSLEALFTKSR